MLYSMTGFASKTFMLTSPSGDKATISINVKALNSRFFETTIKLPPTLSHLETTIMKQCKEALRRGHIYCTAYISNQSVFEGTISPALNIIDSYIQAIEAIKEKYQITDSIKLDNILRLPHIFSQEGQQLDEKSTASILNVVSELIEKVQQDRRTEGNALMKDVLNRIAIIRTEMTIITERAHIFVEEKKKKVHATLQEIGADENLLVNAQKSSLFSMLDKIDIHEEITRLTNHLEQLITQIHSHEIEKGKKLDFTLQELAREINTITAKCSDSIISTHAINVKVEVEKIREQIQNIV